jgi:hypothetical protein
MTSAIFVSFDLLHISIYIFFEVSALWIFKYFGLQTAFPPTLYEKGNDAITVLSCRLLQRRIASERERVALLLPHLKIVENVSIASLVRLQRS